MKLKVCIFILLIAFKANAQAFKVGEKVTDLEFKTILNSPVTSANLSTFQSKVMLIDFWATWCSPCIESFPHLEKLQEKYKNDLQVLTVTNESAERVKRFLQKKKTSLPIVLDKDKKLASQFPHRSIPHTILIDKDGIVKAITSPAYITEEVIRSLVDRESISIPEKRDMMHFDPTKPLSGNSDLISQVTVTPYQEGASSMSNTSGNGVYENRRILAVNLSPKTLYQLAYQAEQLANVTLKVQDLSPFEWNKENAICMDIILPADKGEQRFDVMKQQLDMLYGYKAEFIEQELPVKVLRLIKGRKVKLPVAKGNTQESFSNANGLNAKNVRLSSISDYLGKCCFDVQVIDETGDERLYDIQLTNYPEDPDQIHEELRKLGLELLNEKRKVQVFVISDKK